MEETKKASRRTCFSILPKISTSPSSLRVHRVALIVQIFLSINRPDLAKKEYEKSKKWAEDDLLLQLIESTINLVTGKEGYSDCNSFYTEQLANPSLSSTRLLTARGVTRLLRGEVTEAKSDLEEAISQEGADDETIAAYAVAATLKPSKKGEGDEWWRYVLTRHSPSLLTCDVG